MTPKWVTNLVDALKALVNIPDVWIDAGLYIIIALTAFLETHLSTDDAAKHITPVVLFWFKLTNGSIGATSLALKMYRSNAFASHQQVKKDRDDTTRIIKSQIENG